MPGLVLGTRITPQYSIENVVLVFQFVTLGSILDLYFLDELSLAAARLLSRLKNKDRSYC